MQPNRRESYDEAERARNRGEHARAMEIYEELSRDGDVYSLVFLADIHARGLGTVVDLEMAKKLLDRATALGVTEALFQKANIWFDRGDMHRYFLAVQEAARKGILVAQFYLGLCYVHGRGVPKDRTRALELINDAAERGHFGAKAFLARRLLSRPYNPVGFALGLFKLLSTIIQAIAVGAKNREDERLR